MFDDLKVIMTVAEKKDREEDRDKGTGEKMWAGEGKRVGQSDMWRGGKEK